MKKKLLALFSCALIAAMAMCLAGCSQPEERQDIQITDSGYSVSESGYVLYGVSLHNPNETYAADFVTVTITGKDANGGIVFSQDQVMGTMNPGDDYTFGTQAGNGTAPETVEFSVSVDEDNWKDGEAVEGEPYTISNTNEVINEYGSGDFTGEITVTDAWADYETAWVSAILKDADGNIVGGYNGYANITPNQPAVFDAIAYDLPEYDSVEYYAVPWY